MKLLQLLQLFQLITHILRYYLYLVGLSLLLIGTILVVLFVYQFLEKVIVPETFDHIELEFENDDAVISFTIGILCFSCDIFSNFSNLFEKGNGNIQFPIERNNLKGSIDRIG